GDEMKNERAVFNQIASSQPLRFEQHAMEPLETVLPHPARRARLIPTDDVERGTDADADIGPAFVQARLQPPLLPRRSQGSQYDLGVSSPDLLDQFGVFPRAKLEWCWNRMNRGFWKTLPHLLRRALRYAGGGADERDGAARFGGDLGALPNQIGAVDPATERRAKQRRRPQDGHAVRGD